MADQSTITLEGIDALEQKLTRMRTEDPTFEKRLRGAIREILAEVRKRMSDDAQSGLRMQSDPRSAYKAVRSSVYKRLFGGQVNILDGKGKATGKSFYEPPRHPSRRGGNRIKRPAGGRTEQLMSYTGSQRGFILRFLNAGTKTRYAGYGRNGRTDSDYENFVLKHGGRGKRGAISARNWFGPRSQAEMQNAAANLQDIIDRIIRDEFV